MLTARVKSKYLAHVCTAKNCPARAQVVNPEGLPYYRTHGDPGYHGAFNAFVSIECVSYEYMRPHERVHVVHVSSDDHRKLGERFYWSKP
jgi:hypothetical protein